MAQKEIRYCEKHGNTEFALYKAGKDSTRWRCLKCLTEATQKRRDKVKYMAVAYKGGKCQCCGYHNYIGALEFHHVDPAQKDFGVSSQGYTHSWDKVKQEIDKCVLVCANCHREIHANIIPCPNKILKSTINDCHLASVQEAHECRRLRTLQRTFRVLRFHDS